jgi:type III restriction enzyme
MPVSIKFESNQDYQTEAIESVLDLFIGWESSDSGNDDSEFSDDSDAIFAQTITRNPWGMNSALLRSNAEAIQGRTRLNNVGEVMQIIPHEYRLDTTKPDLPLEDFSVEMETGTGKTYVYLRTALELYLKYGLSKFVVVVPTVAIREGALASLILMKEHFKELYSGVQYDSYVYDSKNLNKLRQFATSSHLQIMVMNIQAFNKDSNIINKEDETGRRPVDYIRDVRPVLIMDEPQKLDAKQQKLAIASLNPLFKLRYSATHKERHCLVYRLGPVDAYQMELVKQIQVLSLSADEDKNVAYVEVIGIKNEGAVKASLRLNRPHGRVRITINDGDDLQEVTGLDIYEGWIVEQIHVPTEEAPGFVEFTNGQQVTLNASNDSETEWWQRAQIRAAVEEHFRAEQNLATGANLGEIKPTKALTLFFIDKVANYSEPDSKFRVWFEEIYQDVAADRRYRNLPKFDAKTVHKGYFATSKGTLKDSREGLDTKDDNDAYNLIMKDKERLLSLEEPVRFIFSHSALQEGWDNPNVFVICNLQETHNIVKRRQQLGRGLRLPVMANGERCRNRKYNVLTVIANEEFEKYAEALQRELVDETGERFTEIVRDARERTKVRLRENYQELPGFKELWEHISPRTKYRLEFSTDDLVDEAVRRLWDIGRANPIAAPKIRAKRTRVGVNRDDGVIAVSNEGSRELFERVQTQIPDILKDLSQQLAVSRATIHRIIMESNRVDDLRLNPAEFSSQVRKAIQGALAHTLKDANGVQYTPIGESYSLEYFERFAEPETYESKLVPVKNSIYWEIPVDSNVERQFAKDLSNRSDIELFLKLPGWYKVATPVGNYNPDWAIVRKREGSDERELYLVRETKGSSSIDDLFRETEQWKVTFGRAHYKSIKVDYDVVVTAAYV